MSENRSLFAKMMAKFSVLEAADKGLDEEMVTDLTSTHVRSSNLKQRPPIAVMRPETRGIVHKVANKLAPIFTSEPISGGQGYFDVRKGGKAGGSAGMQEIAEEADHLVSSKKLFNHPAEKRKRVLKEIEEEFKKRNPEFYTGEET